MKSGSYRIAAGLAGAAAVATGAGILNTGSANAAVVYSGTVNIAIPANIDGVYLNVVTGQTGTTGFAGYDIDPYATSGTTGGQSFYTSTTANATATNRGYVAATTTGAALNLPAGSPIDNTAVYNTGAAGSATTFPFGTTGLLGFRFFNEADSAVHFGWARIQATSSSTTGTPGAIVDYAYESTPLTAIAAGDKGVPEPTSLSLLAVGAVGLLKRRNKR